MKWINVVIVLPFFALSAEAATVRYQHTDMLGSVIAESDAAGNITSRSHYEPFGKRLGGDKAGIGYTGHLQDEDLNLTYMQARYYDPLIGRFYSNDPVGFKDIHSFNRYSYGNNNPYRFTDPDGKASQEANLWANLFGIETAEQANYVTNQKIESVGNAMGQAVSAENLNSVSNVLAGTTVVALAVGQPEVAAITGAGSFITGVGAAVQSDNPTLAVGTEVVLQVSGTKSIGTMAKITKGIAESAKGSSKVVSNGIDAASDAAQTAAKNELKEMNQDAKK